MGHCESCGEAIRPNAKFCLKCGRSVPSGESQGALATDTSDGNTGVVGVSGAAVVTALAPAKSGHPARVIAAIAGVVVIGIIIALVLQHQHQLKQEDAVRILRGTNAFQPGSYFRVSKSEQASMDPRGCFQFQNKPGWQALTDLGFATLGIRTTSEATAFAYSWYGCTLELTPAGQQQLGQWRPWSGPLDTGGWEIPLATAQFVDATGINQTDGENAQVQYMYRWNPTPFAQALGKVPDASPKAGTALFHRTSDGWRLQDLGFGSIPEPQISDGPPTLTTQADWSAYMTNESVNGAINFDLSQDGGGTWQSFSLAPRTMGIYKRMNRFRLTTNFPDGHTQTANYPLPTHGVKYYSINCQGENCMWDLSGDDEFVALSRANR